ncbi:GNAT family N-acetyltransferase [Vibrio sp. SM6]|uniref:GNAT family N-acetyltransferase n=1 Tax=Vibrio agarilyticus TaxID=2726741 RepID=A0A7X8YIA6_9VIBR|nr:GNAT family protein [Vibrio agarilyticus]NLS14410.1 GNAT family N-acetyltransferase [Vibrio agarilyticus]
MIELRAARREEADCIYQLMLSDMSWKQFDAPYVPFVAPSLREFRRGMFSKLVVGDEMQLIVVDQRPIGIVTRYWECHSTRWLEVGIAIYDSSYWQQGVGYQALISWISHLFAQQRAIARIGLTTWSGNPRMMACASKLGMTLEGRLRKVRYFEGVYYDSLRYGVLREEWVARYGDRLTQQEFLSR